MARHVVGLAEVAASVGATDLGTVVAPLLEPFSGQAAVVAQGVVSLGAVDRYLGLLAGLRGDAGSASDAYARAAMLEARIAAPTQRSRTLRAWAASERDQGAPGRRGRSAAPCDGAGVRTYSLRPAFDPERPHHWERYVRGQLPTDARPGDFILSYRGWHVFSALIRLGQGLRVHGDDRRRYARWSHAALVVGRDELIEMHKPGAIRTPFEEYREVDFALVRVHATEADREQAVAFATWCLDQNHEIGRATFLSLALCLSTGCKFSFFVEGSMVCSGMVARCQERTGAIFNRTPSHISPADLAKYYDVDFTRSIGPTG